MIATRGLVKVGVLLAFALPWLRAQEPERFEVVSIKPNTSANEASIIRTPPGGNLNATNVALPLLLHYAYRVASFQVEGLPEWSRERFDIVARAPETPSAHDVRAMVRAMLADRFHLVTHRETREGSLLALTLARAGEPGSELHPTQTECPEGNAVCGVRLAVGRIEATAAEMGEVASALELVLERPVVDRTALQGRFDFRVDFTPDSTGTGADPNQASALPTALQEQLGLKLDSRRGPIEKLVIDRVERTTTD